MKRAFFAAALVLLLLSGCTKPENVLPPPAGTDEPEVITEPENQAEPDITLEPEEPEKSEENAEPLEIYSSDDIASELAKAIFELRQPVDMAVENDILSEYPDIDVKNLYYGILKDNPELKYAYDITSELSDGILRCSISYMPYKTGEYPEGFEGISVGSLQELIDAAEGNYGSAPTAVRITSAELQPDDMNRALQQAGGGYILCELSRDGTEIIYSTPQNMTIEECVEALYEADELADEIIAETVSEGMTEREKAEALYAYVTANVKYDQRYYSGDMPYESQTALGALREGTAICGGYAHAVKLLFNKAGIPCCNVTGKYFTEYHMWNIACLDGEWLWFDAAVDRGNVPEYGFLRFALTELDGTKYKWDDSTVKPLLT